MLTFSFNTAVDFFKEVLTSVAHDEQIIDPLCIIDIHIIARVLLLSRFFNKHMILWKKNLENLGK